MATRRIDRMNADAGRFPAGHQAAQRSLPEAIADDEGRHDYDSEPGDGGRSEHFTIVRAQRSAHLDGNRPIRPNECPGVLARLVRVDEAVVSGEVLGLARFAATREIVGGSGCHATDRPDAPRDEAGVSEVGDAQRDIDALLQKIDGAVAQGEIDGYVGITRQERRQDRTDMADPEGHRRADAQPAAGRSSGAAHLTFGLGHVIQDARAPLIIGSSRLREAEAPRGPVEEAYAQPLLKPRYLLARRSTGNTKVARRRRKSFEFDDPPEDPHGG